MSYQLPAFPAVSSMLPMVAMPVVALPSVVVMYVPVVAAPAVAPAPAAAPAAAPKAKEHKEPPAPKEKETPRPGAGLPAALIQHLRTEGPYTANEIFITVPTQSLGPVPETTPVPEWYVITRGRALSDVAISGVAGVRKVYNSQDLALEAFNSALQWGIVQVVAFISLAVD
ncbi:hypothetical protein R3P38DRAFT_3195614 [Favolaschia claudopus]|uniref:Uncharacterized protein n=1 Tax=Favolaschia claudopus TaxID=2862362 RepID=A0AAW0B904_9AGAR